MIDNMSIAPHTFVRCMLTTLSINEILLPRYVNQSTNFRDLLFKVEKVPSCLKEMNGFI